MSQSKSNDNSGQNDFITAYSSLQQKERDDIEITVYFLAERLLHKKYKTLFDRGYRASDYYDAAIEKTKKANPIRIWRDKTDFIRYICVVMRHSMIDTLGELQSSDITYIPEELADSEQSTDLDPVEPGLPTDDVIAEVKKIFAARPLSRAIYDDCIAQDAFKISSSNVSPKFRIKEIARRLGVSEKRVEKKLQDLKKSPSLAKLRKAIELYMEGKVKSLEEALVLVREEKKS